MAGSTAKSITTDRALATLSEAGKVYSNSMRTGLYLRVPKEGIRRWLFVYTRNGKRREIGLGVVDGPRAVPLKKARDQARAYQAALAAGEDPWTDKKKAKAAAKIPHSENSPTPSSPSRHRASGTPSTSPNGK